ncbi:MAG TPA: lysozyme inhibitor LprI family protein [Chthoniobacterales bacterium]|nr:lysozyme inhibitor LprI family protein [Chthoniobacterales bacterium]
MKSARCVVLVAVIALAWSQSGRSEENETSVFVSPSGVFRIEASGSDAFVISTKDSSQKVKVPMPEGEDYSPDDEFYFSPNDEWIFGGRHVGSCLRDGDLYHRSDSAKIDSFENFSEQAWKNCAKLKVLKTDYASAGGCAMTFFAGWSIDSHRLLIGMLGGEDRRDMHSGYLYFNAGTKEFETSNYLKKLSAMKSAVLPCAEPIDPLPSEAELKARADTADKQLNDAYSAKIQKVGKDGGSNLRDSQRAWVKARDAGLQIYLAAAPAAERERRKLQFLGDVTIARIESLNSGPAEEGPFDFWERISSR